ncbi:polysaccharide deacetylase family protein [Heliophilum fasciatum]|uniref:Peptidoglycan/xylan/chitin deacetylase (PgdA/CDA1 family) n=1 Tax=Heliophilum fasciatum TaxID=35700 RepID=A0A4R2SCT4_9FIRM|nr:polysaccharide deacetylase family protein [Heliophilum fasciatum]MCW2276664.1 peptidoglycan/xylan/chitin deacetylase (PgdA/CDA1 family) [Heliophilum fasciatum]TCP68955.1 peptidoglycan/xylan/chitin deacetylase (PgdA/CDA1 family) [Heliophilum fasciatum]
MQLAHELVRLQEENDRIEREIKAAVAMRGLAGRPLPLAGFEVGENRVAVLLGQAAYDPTNFSQGVRALQVTGNRIHIVINGSWDVSQADALAVDIYPHAAPSLLTSLVIKFFAGEGKRKGFSSGEIKARIRVDRQWQTVAVRKSDFLAFGGATVNDWAAIQGCEVTATGDARGLSLDDLRGVRYGTKRGKVIVRFDDGFQSVYAVALPYMARKGLVGFASVIVGNIGKIIEGRLHMTVEQIRALQSQGWDISSHTMSHPSLPNLDGNPALLEYEIGASYRWLRHHGFAQGAQFFVFPGHQVSAMSYQKARDYHTLAYGGADCIDTFPPLGRWTMHSTICENRTAAQIQALIDDCANHGGLLTITFHDLVPVVTRDDQVTIETFQAVIDHLVRADVDVITLTDLAQSSPLAAR